jgi:two-component system phosphate regulon sensor histidine kinase PhoR
MAARALSSNQATALAGVPAFVLLAALTASQQISVAAAIAVALAWTAGLVWLAARDHRRPPPAARPAVPVPQVLPEHVLEQIPDPVLLVSAARVIVAANRPARDIIGIAELGRDLSLSLRHPLVLDAVEAVAAGQPSRSEEITLPLATPRVFTMHVGRLPAAGGPSAPRIVLVLRDETRMKRVEQSRADFVANASHELRSPLAVLIGFIETLRGPASDDAAARERFLAIMQGEARRMARLVDDLMSLTRVEINEHVPPRGGVDLRPLLAAVADALAVRARERGMAIELDCPEGLPPVAGDADQLTQVFHNLVDNAVKYGRSGTPIRILAVPLDKLPGTDTAGVSVSVIDRGDGIAAIHLPRLTERFYRADEGRSRRLGGTGLGLAIVKHIVNRHRGRLTIDSEEGAGTTVTVYLRTKISGFTEPAAASAGRA